MNNEQNFVLIDATLESHANFFAESPIFQPWLHSYNNIPDALTFIDQIRLECSIDVYIARDNILDDVLSSQASNQTRPLIQVLNDLETIHSVVVFTPTMNTEDSKPHIRSVINDPRLLRKVISVVSLRRFMCTEGINYYDQRIDNCVAKKETHLIEIFLQNRNDLWSYQKQLKEDQERKLEALQEEHSNKPSEDAT